MNHTFLFRNTDLQYKGNIQHVIIQERFFPENICMESIREQASDNENYKRNNNVKTGGLYSFL